MTPTLTHPVVSDPAQADRPSRGAGAAARPPAGERALRRASLFRRLVRFWTGPLGGAVTATDAATRLEILSRGGFPR